MYIGNGFVPALGTPLDDNGCVIEESLRKEVEDQIKAGAAGLLCMGSMGIQAYIDRDEAPKIAAICVDQAAGRVPVFVGAMDCTVKGAAKRMAAMDDIDVTAFVFTTPYYAACPKDGIITFYKKVAASTKHNIMMYDLPSVTQSKITYDIVTEVAKSCPNLIGIKTNDAQLIRKIKLLGELPEDFITCYSGLDVFDVSYEFGFKNYLDGMISCCPKTFEKMDKAFLAGDIATASKCLTNVVALRDLFLKYRLMAAFTIAMNLEGYEGRFHNDYTEDETDLCREDVKAMLIKMGEL